MHDFDFLRARTLLPHSVFLGGLPPTDEAIELELGWLAATGSTIVHCQLVMARHGDMLRSFTRLRDHRINVGLGTDTWPPDVLLNCHVGMMTTRIADGSMRVRSGDYYTAATIGGAHALGRSDLGRLMPGAKADITVLDLKGPHLGQVLDPIQTMITAGRSSDFRTVIVNGRFVVEDGSLPGVDLEAWHNQAQRQFNKLIASAPERAVGHPSVEELYEPSFPIVTNSTST